MSICIRTINCLIGDVSEKVFVVLLSAVVAHGDMKRKGKGKETAMHRGAAEVKHEFVPARSSLFQVFPSIQNIVKVRISCAIFVNINFIHSTRFLVIRLSVVSHRCTVAYTVGTTSNATIRSGYSDRLCKCNTAQITVLCKQTRPKTRSFVWSSSFFSLLIF